MARRWFGASCLVLAVLVLASGCSRAPESAAGASRPGVTGADPRELVRALRAAQQGGEYEEVAAGIAGGRGGEVVALLQAINEFLGANEQLCQWVRERVGVGAAQMIDQSYIVDDLSPYVGESMGVFSRDVALLDVRRAAAEVTVAYKVGGRLPARSVTLVRADGEAWRLRVDEPCGASLPEAFAELRRGLETVLLELQQGRHAAEALRRDPERLVELVKLRLGRGVRLLSKARTGVGAGDEAE